MKNYPRHRANTPKDLFKETHEEILKAAKRKHSKYGGEFYLFFTYGFWSECCVDIYGSAKEHWKKINGHWERVN